MSRRSVLRPETADPDMWARTSSSRPSGVRGERQETLAADDVWARNGYPQVRDRRHAFLTGTSGGRWVARVAPDPLVYLP